MGGWEHVVGCGNDAGYFKQRPRMAVSRSRAGGSMDPASRLRRVAACGCGDAAIAY